MITICRFSFLGLVVFCLACIALSQSGRLMKISGWALINDAERQEVFAFNEAYKDYLRIAKTELSSTREVLRLAKLAGFSEYSKTEQVKSGAKLFFNNRDRALALDGRIDLRDGRTIIVETGKAPEDPIFLIADAAPHSDAPYRKRTYMNVIEGEELNPIVGSVPDEGGSTFNGTLKEIFERYGITEEDFISAELSFVPVYPPHDVGFDRGLTAAFGQDDRLSSYVAVRAIIDLKQTPTYTAIAYLADNEESGSNNNTGAASVYLNNLYATLVSAQRGRDYSDTDTRKALSNAQVISADLNDAVNPIFLQGAEVLNTARLGYGVTIKRYGRGFDANSEFTARMRKLLHENEIPYQTHTYKVGVGGGGTIGGFLSREDMEVIDLGVPVLSMHSPYELSSKVDVWNFYRFMIAFYGH